MRRIVLNSSEADRLAVAAVLLKNRYTVRLGQEVPQGKRKPVYFVEYTEPGEEKSPGVPDPGRGEIGATPDFPSTIPREEAKVNG